MSTLNLNQICQQLQNDPCCEISDELYRRISLMLACSINTGLAEAVDGEVTEKVAEICALAPENCCALDEKVYQRQLLTILCNLRTNVALLAPLPQLLTGEAGGYYQEDEEPNELVFNADMRTLPLTYSLIVATTYVDNPPVGTTFVKAAYYLNEDMALGSQLIVTNGTAVDIDLFSPGYVDTDVPPSAFTINGSSYSESILVGGSAIITRTGATNFTIVIG